MKKILVIDDDKIFIKIFRDSIYKDHKNIYEVESAGNGEEGLAKIEVSRPDLIVLDIKMPKMDGIEFLRKLKEQKYETQTPVLISSNFSDAEKISEGLELGVIGYVVKSDYSMDSIIKRVHDVLGASIPGT
ncbi:MAG: response regulator [Candidatus Pacebacteria bacterium]|nr:response regulator [Candidatus Paceibacterota bacterium]